MIGRFVRRALIRFADLIDDRFFDHRHHAVGFCLKIADHPWWME